MVKLEDAVIARFEHGGEKFELLVDPYLALDLKHGKTVKFEELLAAETVFKDSRKGEEKSPESLKKVFGTTDISEIAKKIVTEGEVQLTTVQRRDLMEKRKKEVITFIAKNAVNPQVKAPHPPVRIENALDEIRFSFDLNRPFNHQVEQAVKELKKVLPISMEKLKIAVKIPSVFAGKASAVLHKYEIVNEEWQASGSLICVVLVPAGVKQDLFGELNHLTHGDFESKLLEE
ncbi:MAG: ribosome assembly factor SBDS [Candidatus Diapherotrites archaeon]|nr:ribosome assembly factor SBDS [Candidatus Diapherotrites archaeon]